MCYQLSCGPYPYRCPLVLMSHQARAATSQAGVLKIRRIRPAASAYVMAVPSGSCVATAVFTARSPSHRRARRHLVREDFRDR